MEQESSGGKAAFGVARRKLVLSALAALLCAGASLLPTPVWAGISVTRYVFARGIAAKEPVGAAETFPADVGTLYFFTQILGAQGNVDLLHVWIYDGREIAIVPIEVQGSPWRTWSARSIGLEQRGDWIVEVREMGGKVLATATCRIE